jgi:uncharacterized protein (DUF2249 family)/iron-sulfur cluster repair protein YtfE (RIC family)
MSSLTEAIRNHHRSLAKTLEAHVRGVGGDEPQTGRDALVAFLKGDLLPHASSEERHLYGAVDELVRKHGQATATMMVDHEFIRDYVVRIEGITRQLGAASDGDRSRLLRQLRELALRLDAIVELHLAKEERIYLPLIERQVDEAHQRQLLEAIHESYEAERKIPTDSPLDVRNVVPRERHTLIFDSFAALKPDQAFVLINDHDPRPLYYQFEAERTGQFSWDYLEQGPEVWRVRIGRRA